MASLSLSSYFFLSLVLYPCQEQEEERSRNAITSHLVSMAIIIIIIICWLEYILFLHSLTQSLFIKCITSGGSKAVTHMQIALATAVQMLNAMHVLLYLYLVPLCHVIFTCVCVFVNSCNCSDQRVAREGKQGKKVPLHTLAKY